MRDSSSSSSPRAVRPSRRAVLGLAAAAPLALAAPASAAPERAAAFPRQGGAPRVIGGERLGLRGVQVHGALGLPRKLTARSWLVADHDSGEVLAAYDAHRRLAPASTLKMLFADTLLKKFERTRTYRVTDEDLADVPDGSSLVGVKAGITYTVEELWLGVFLRSGNDAVHVLSHMNGGLAKTVAEMQAQAYDLQALDTHVVSPDGFDHKGQICSAYDLTLFARHGLKNPAFRGYCATRTADFPAGGKKTFQIQNTDRLLTGAWGLEPYKGLIGVKNGFTSNAGNTFTGAATRDGRTLLVTVMHPRSGGNTVYEETAALLDWGFARGATGRAVGTLVDPLSEGGSRAASASAKGKGLEGARGAEASGVGGGGPSWGLVGGIGGAMALLAGGGALALRGRRRGTASAGSPGASGASGGPGDSRDSGASGEER
ncbi:D-alanyl-D-alanine carboxypeptidase [Streptomyces sp. RY43-2]|uniref:D-alanyl-D-alanine carboxypeptidase n=1 Tax=Streptomyces macrolidinus TaxID=2952607 RepID=A0ABT0Z868_9ACTN|nr:D-alanyl-D-alanine carboxypeptidase [Streptomyces macrolidinus]MCN9239960.1 D-alanyl-D-alanine carboxypeptidase [Streptomyces macrolidinus]